MKDRIEDAHGKADRDDLAVIDKVLKKYVRN